MYPVNYHRIEHDSFSFNSILITPVDTDFFPKLEWEVLDEVFIRGVFL